MKNNFFANTQYITKENVNSYIKVTSHRHPQRLFNRQTCLSTHKKPFYLNNRFLMLGAENKRKFFIFAPQQRWWLSPLRL